MDLQVVEMQVSLPDAHLSPSSEVDVFRTSGAYDLARGSVSFMRPQLLASEISERTVDSLATLGGHIADAVAAGYEFGRNVVIAGGNCTSLPGIIGGLQQAHGATTRIGLVWFDAHGDFNTPKTSLTGRLGGMPVAVSAGLCFPEWRIGAHQQVTLPTERIIMVDVRNLDPAEAQLVRATGVNVVPVIGPLLGEAVSKLAREVDLIYLHVDLDVLDASLAPSHDTKEPNGPDIAETLSAIQTVIDTGIVRAFGLVAIYPIREGADVSLRSATELLRESIRYWADQDSSRL